MKKAEGKAVIGEVRFCYVHVRKATKNIVAVVCSLKMTKK